MNSFLEKILSFRVILAFAFIVIGYEAHYLQGLYPKGGWLGPILLSAIPLLLALAKLELVWFFCIGHATTHKRTKIGRFPVVTIFVLVILIALASFGIHCASQLSQLGFADSSVANSFVFSINLMLAVVMSASRWYVVLYFKYWAGSEIELIQWLQFNEIRGLDAQRVRQYFKDEGMVNSDIPVPREAMLP